MFALLKKQNWKRVAIIYEEEDKYWQRLKDATLKSPVVHVASIHQVPRVNKFNRYGERFLEFEEMRQRNESLARVRSVLRAIAHNDEVNGKLVLICQFRVVCLEYRRT